MIHLAALLRQEVHGKLFKSWRNEHLLLCWSRCILEIKSETLLCFLVVELITHRLYVQLLDELFKSWLSVVKIEKLFRINLVGYLVQQRRQIYFYFWLSLHQFFKICRFKLQARVDKPQQFAEQLTELRFGRIRVKFFKTDISSQKKLVKGCDKVSFFDHHNSCLSPDW